MTQRKIGILGTGDVGRALGAGFAARGERVTIGTRDPRDTAVEERMGSFLSKHRGRVEIAAYAGAVEGADVVVLATAWSGLKSAIDLAGGPTAFDGKVVLDATNPLVRTDKGSELELGHRDSGGEQVQRWLPGAKVVKVFNTIGHALMVDPQLPGGPPTMFFCGNDEGAKKVASEIVARFGHEPVDVGGIEGARLLEPMCVLWVRHAMRSKSRDHAFTLIHR